MNLSDILKYFGVAGSTVADTPGATVPNVANLRRIRVDNDGNLTVVAGGGAPMDVNVAEVAGNATATGAVPGTVVTEGAEAAGANPVSNPHAIAGLDPTSALRRILTDLAGNLSVVGTQAAETAADDGSWPVKAGSLVRHVLTLLTDGDIANLLADAYGRLWVVTAGFDSLLDAIKVALVNPESANRDSTPQTIAAADDTAAGTYNYPSDAGLEVGDRSQIFGIMKLDDVTSVAVQASEDGTNWVDVTQSIIDEGQGPGGSYAATHYTAAAGVDTFFAFSWAGRFGHRYIRWQVVYPNATNEFDLLVTQRAL